MSLPSPNLDDRKFQDIVDDVKRQIGLRCPEWTDHNVSDPGVTLIELFAWMMEGTLFRLNQVPEKNYIKFLELLGITLESAAPAQTELCFRLSRPIEDSDDEGSSEQVLRAYQTVAATIRTETEDAIEFTTEADLVMVRPRLTHILSASQAKQDSDLANVREFQPASPDDQDVLGTELDESGNPRPKPRNGFGVFGNQPREGDALYLGFEADISGNMIELEAVCNRAAATGLNEEYPSQVWEYWDVQEGRWDRIAYVVSDTTYGFNRTGTCVLLMPRDLMPSTIGSRQARWVRCRYTTSVVDLPPVGMQELRPSAYQRSPEVFALTARTVGGGAPATNCTIERDEYLGQSDGTPGQVFQLRYAPILPRQPGETLLVGEQGMLPMEMEAWTEVEDFSESSPDDKHFVCDSFTGEVFFGPSVPQPDGSALQHGAVPPNGFSCIFSAYRHGGSVSGNVRENQIRILKTSVPYISDVWNPVPAAGGRNEESIERAKLRARSSLRIRERAVTAEDYEFLACRASSAVGRAHCTQPGPRHHAGKKGDQIPPGMVKVLVVPNLSSSVTVPRPADLRVPQRTIDEVQSFLDQRRLLTAVLEVGEPDYLFVSTDVTLVADPKADAEQVAREVRDRLEAYTHPLWGGPSQDGWPFRRSLTLADVYAQVGSVPGVAFLLDARMFTSRLENAETGRLAKEQPVTTPDGICLGEKDLICTREHRVHVRPLWSVGMESPESAKE